MLVASAEGLHGDALEEFRAVERCVQDRARSYGEKQLRVQVETLGAWVEWLESNEHLVNLVDRSTLDGVEAEMPNIPELKAQVVQGVKLLSGGTSAAVGAVAAYQTAIWGVTSFAAASTGTAISGLSGAAATNATLAWLGGGTIAAGGGGMALGAIMLTGIAAAPAALIGGFTFGIQGHRAMTKATEIDACVAKAVAEMRLKQSLLAEIPTRIDELEVVLDDTNRRAVEALEVLKGHAFDPQLHLEQFQQTALLMRAVGEILSTRILDRKGELTAESLKVREKYTQ